MRNGNDPLFPLRIEFSIDANEDIADALKWLSGISEDIALTLISTSLMLGSQSKGREVSVFRLLS